MHRAASEGRSLRSRLELHRRLPLAIALLAMIVALTDCSAVRRISVPARPRVMPSAEQLQAKIDARRQVVHSMRALARLSYRHPEATSLSREAIVLERPDRLRIEVLSFLGAVGVLTTQDNAFTVYARHENKIYRGEASSKNMWRYARIGLPVVDLVDLVLGTPPQRQANWTHVTYDADTGWIQLSQELDSGALVVWFENDLPRAAELRDGYGEVQWRALFSKYQKHNDIMIASKIRLEVPDGEHSVKIELEDIDVNPVLDRNTFAFLAPAGAKVVELDEEDPRAIEVH